MYLMELAQEDAARGSCRVARAVESGLQGGAHASVLGRWRTEPEDSIGPRILRGKERFSRGRTQNFAWTEIHGFQSHTTRFFEVGQRS